jgi:Na+/melibiose symporter-like transporter
MGDFDPAIYAQSNIVSGIKWMFVVIPFVLLAICLFFAIKTKVNKQRFDAVIKGIEALKTNGSINALTEQEQADILIAAGVERDRLWGVEAKISAD